MRVNPATLTPTLDMRQGAAHAHAIGPTRGLESPRAYHRAHARCEERRQQARSEQFRTQFD